jgi:hypothetical protein
LMWETMEFHTTDARDKLYALLGMAKENLIDEKFAFSIYADYTMPSTEVFIRITRYIVEHQQSLAILSMVDVFSKSRCEALQSLDIPTWVPTFGDGLSSGRILGNKGYQATSERVPSLDVMRDQRLLGISGMKLDEIRVISSPLAMAKAGFDLLVGSESNGLLFLWNMVRSNQSIHPIEDLFESFMLTLTCGHARKERDLRNPWESNGNITTVYPPKANELRLLRDDFAGYWDRFDPLMKKWHEYWREVDPRLRRLDWKRLIIATQRFRGSGSPFAYHSMVRKFCEGRSFFITCDGRMGLCPSGAQPGDLVVRLYGGTVPYILRSLESRSTDVPEPNHHLFVGECYVHGVMQGELLGDDPKHQELFCLV